MLTKITNSSSTFKLIRNIYRTQSTSPKPLRPPKTIGFPKEQIIKVGRYNINYTKVGNGEHTVLCLPGALGTIWSDFQHQIEDFDQEKFTLVVWDPPGYGKSRPPDKDYPINFFEQDALAAAEFMKALNIPTYSILGWSNGATTSFILAARNRDAVKKLVVWGAISFIMPHELGWYKKIQDIHTTWSKSRKELLTDVYGEEGLANYWNRLQHCMERIYTQNNGNICKELLKDIQCPTFLLYGLKEPLVDKFHVSYIQSQIPDTRLFLYPEGKHNIHIRYSKDFNTRVQNFLLET